MGTFLAMLMTYPLQKIVGNAQISRKLNYEKRLTNRESPNPLRESELDLEDEDVITHSIKLWGQGFLAYYEGCKYKVLAEACNEGVFSLINNLGMRRLEKYEAEIQKNISLKGEEIEYRCPSYVRFLISYMAGKYENNLVFLPLNFYIIIIRNFDVLFDESD